MCLLSSPSSGTSQRDYLTQRFFTSAAPPFTLQEVNLREQRIRCSLKVIVSMIEKIFLPAAEKAGQHLSQEFCVAMNFRH